MDTIINAATGSTINVGRDSQTNDSPRFNTVMEYLVSKGFRIASYDRIIKNVINIDAEDLERIGNRTGLTGLVNTRVVGGIPALKIDGVDKDGQIIRESCEDNDPIDLYEFGLFNVIEFGDDYVGFLDEYGNDVMLSFFTEDDPHHLTRLGEVLSGSADGYSIYQLVGMADENISVHLNTENGDVFHY